MNCEKELKRFIKKSQNFSFTMAALVLFLITGMVSFGAEDIIKSNEELLKEVSKSKEEIQELLDENEKSLTTDDLAIQELVDKGAFMVKPLWDSWQFGVDYTYGSMHSEDDGRGNGYDMVRREDGKLVNEDYIDGTADGSIGRFGIVEQSDKEGTITVFARVQPKDLPTIPSAPGVSVNPSVTVPNVTAGDSIPNINVDSIASIDIDVPTVSVNPTLPDAVDVVEVETPEVSVEVPQFPQLTIALQSAGNAPRINFDSPTIQNGVIESVKISSGTFDLTNDSSGYYNYSYNNYSAVSADGVTGADGGVNAGQTSISNASGGGTSNTARPSFFKLVGFEAMTLDPGVIVDIRLDGDAINDVTNAFYTDSKGTTYATHYEVLHFDDHGENTRDYDSVASGLNSNQQAITTEAEKYITNDPGSRPALVFINEGEMNIYGDPIAVSSFYNHSKHGNEDVGLLANAGDIVLKDYTTETIGSTVSNPANNGNNLGLAYSADFIDLVSHVFLNNDLTIYNSGKLQMDTQISAGLYSGSTVGYDSTNMNTLTFVNDGEVSMNGYQGTGVYLYDGNQVKLVLNKPVAIYGDGGVGVYVNSGVNFVNEDSTTDQRYKTIVKVNIGMDASGAEKVNSEGGTQVDTNGVYESGGVINADTDKIEGATGFYTVGVETTGVNAGESSRQVVNEYQINLASNTVNSLGFATKSGADVSFESGEINILGSGNIGMYSPDTSSTVTADAVIVEADPVKTSENNVGVYLDGGSVFSLGSASTGANFVLNSVEVNGKSNVGVVNSGSTIEGDISMVTNAGAVGVYLENGGVISDPNSTLSFENGDPDTASTGVYAGQSFTLGSGQTITDTNSAEGVILLTGGNYTFKNSGLLDVNNSNSIGAYVSQGTFSNDGTIKVDKGTGVYLDTSTNDNPNLGTITTSTDRMEISNGGKALVINGNGSYGGTTTNLYVDAVAGTSNIALLNSNRSIANAINIDGTGDGIIGMYGTDGSFGNTANIDVLGDYTIGIYGGGTGSEVGSNSGAVTVKGVSTIGMLGRDISVENAVGGTVEVDDSGAGTSAGNSNEYVIGMAGIKGSNATTDFTIKNSGSINLTNTSGGLTIGMAGMGDNSSNVPILQNTGTITMNGEGSIGAYIKDGAKLDSTNFSSITDNSSGNGVAVLSDGGVIDGSGTLDFGSLNGKIGVLSQNDSGDIAGYDGKIKVGDTVGSDTAVAMYYDLTTSGVTGDVNIQSDLEVGSDGVGLYLNNSVANSETVVYNGELNVGESGGSDIGGVGIYLTGDTTLKLDDSLGGKINMNSLGGTAFYIGDGATLDINSLGSQTTIEFNQDGTMVFAERTQITYGFNDFNIIDNGNTVNIATVSEGFIDVDPGAATIGGTRGFSAIYGIVHTDGGTDINSMTNGAIGVYVQGHQNTYGQSSFAGVFTASDIEVINNGSINLTGDSSVGVAAISGRVENNGSIDVAKDSIGIYLDEDGTLTNSGAATGTNSAVTNTGSITIGDGSIGIYQNSINVTGSIDNQGAISSSTGSKGNIGIYSNGTGISTNSGTITLGEEGVGIVSNGNSTVTTTGDITVGKIGAGIISNENSMVNVDLGSNITVGDGGTVAYTDSGTININGGTFAGGDNSNLFLADGDTASGTTGTINYNGTNTSFTSNGENLFIGNNGGSVNLGSGIYSATTSNGGVAVFVGNGGSVNAGTLNITTNNGGIGVYNDNGTIGGTVNVDMVGDSSVGYFYKNATSPLTINNGSVGLTMNGVGNQKVAYVTEDITGVINGGNFNLVGGDENVGFFLAGSGGAGTTYSFDNGGNTITLGDSVTKNNVGIFLNNTGTLNVTNLGTINTGAGNVGIFSKGSVVATGGGTINLGDSSGGIYGAGDVTTDATIIGSGDASYGALALGNLNYSGSNITVSGGNGYGLIGNGSVTTSGSGTITLSGDSGLGIFSGNTASAGITPTSSEKIVNTMDIVSTGLVGTAIQGINTNIDNGGDLTTGVGGTGIYGEARGNNNIEVRNTGNILVEDSHFVTTTDIDYAVGMGIVTDDNGVGGTATLVNDTTGVVEVTGNQAVGMYGSGSGSTVINDGTIVLDPNSGSIDSITGMYLINGAQGVNNGTIRTDGDLTGLSNVDVAVGVAAYGNGTHFTNNGLIDMKIDNGIGVLINEGGTFTNNGTVTLTGAGSTAVKGSQSDVSTGSTGLNGPSIFDNTGLFNIGSGMSLSKVTIYNTGQISTTGVVGLDGVDLILTTEADPDDIFIGSGQFVIGEDGVNIKLDSAASIDNVNGNKTAIDLSDYTKSVIDQFVTGNSYTGDLTFSSNSLTWDYDLATASLTKKSYADFVSDSNLKNFADGLDERYEDADPNSEETDLFQSLNNISTGDYAALDAAFEEMSGSEYANIQTRMKQVNEDFASGVDELMSWENLTKDNNKVALIGSRRDYEIDTAGVYDYDYYSQGAMYLNSFEDLNYGEQKGYYLGFLHDEIDFDNEGDSEEEGYTLMAGVFNEHSFDTEDKTSLLTKVEVFGGYRDMERKFYVYDDTYETDGDYYTYGINIINDLSYDYRVNKHFTIVPNAGFTLGYGRFTEIEEDGDVVDLEVDDNDYIVAEPSVGVDFKATMPISETMDFVASIGTEVTYDFGTRDYDNEARVRHTSADSYDLENPDEERYNLNTNARIGLEKDSFGVGAEVGYKTVGDEVYGSIDMKIKF